VLYLAAIVRFPLLFFSERHVKRAEDTGDTWGPALDVLRISAAVTVPFPFFLLTLLLPLDVYFNFTSPGIFIHEIHFSSNTFFSVPLLPRINIGSDWVYVRSVHLKTNSRSLSDSNARVSSEDGFLRGFVLNERYCSRVMLHALLKSLCLFLLNWIGSRRNDSFADYSHCTALLLHRW